MTTLTTKVRSYFLSLFELILFSFIASPVAALLMTLLIDTVPPLTTLSDAGGLMLQAMLWVPLTCLPFFLFFAAPYISYLKLNSISSNYRWVIGMAVLAVLYPVLMHSLKFALLGMLGIYNAATVVFSAYTTLYVYYGVHTLTMIVVSLLVYFWCHR